MRLLATLVVFCAAAGVAATRWDAPPARPAVGQVATARVDRGGVPERPREQVDISEPVQTGARIAVGKNGNFQAALDRAQPGDTIVLQPGATYTGPFRLPAKAGSGWILITSAAVDRLPPAGHRVTPADASHMPKLRASGRHVIIADDGAHHYRFTGIEIAPLDGSFLYSLVQLGDDQRDLRAVPHHVVLDRTYLHGDATQGTRRGVALNARHSAVVNSYLSDFKETGADSQAIAGFNGPGPFLIANNYLEAAGENVMFGGADPSIRDLVPADIEIRGNHLAKPVKWKADHPTYDGSSWTIKNLFELKNARRVLVDGNLLEYNWIAAQNGFAVLFTVRNQDGGAPWSVVEDVTFANNLVRHVGAGINVLGRDDIHSSDETRRLAIHNNFFLDVGGAWGSGRLLQLLDGARDITVDRNTAFQTGGLIFGGDRTPHHGFVFENNVALHNGGITGSGVSAGLEALGRYFPGAIVRGNVIVSGSPAEYPPGNTFRATIQEAGFLKQADGSYRMRIQSATAGADVEGISRAMARVANPRRRPIDADAVQGGASGGFWLCAVILIYVYFGYPAIAWLRACWRPRPIGKAPSEPTVSIIVVACNEADRIEQRIRNLQALDYPAHLVEIILGSDGSTDDTAERAARFASPGVQVHAFGKRRGKPAVLNELVSRAAGDLIVFADARQRFDRAALRALTSCFADRTIGAVSGELMLSGENEAAAAGRGCGFYWRYEKFIRLQESRVSSTVGATGAIYAIRRELFDPIPPDTILDDVLIPLRIVRRGFRVAFEAAARAYDEVSRSAQQEYQRKVRTIAGNFQLFARERWLLNPSANAIWFETVSHKLLRLAIPALHAGLLAANVRLASEGFYQLTLTAQLMFYAAALAGHFAGTGRRHTVVLSVPYAMCLLCWATVAGFGRFVTRRQRVTWQRIDDRGSRFADRGSKDPRYVSVGSTART